MPLDHKVLHATFEDQVTPIAPATGAFTDDARDTDALTVADGPYKVVFLAFPFEAYGSAAQTGRPDGTVAVLVQHAVAGGTGRPGRPVHLLRRGRALEAITLAWNVVGMLVLAFAAWTAGSVALAGFGLDSLIEIGASAVVLWELAGTRGRQRIALRLIGYAFALLVVYLLVQSVWALAVHHVAEPSPSESPGPRPPPRSCAAAFGKHQTGARLGNPVLSRGQGDRRGRRPGTGGPGRPVAERWARVVVGRPGRRPRTGRVRRCRKRPQCFADNRFGGRPWSRRGERDAR